MSVIPGCTCNHPRNWDMAVIWHEFTCRYRLNEEERMSLKFQRDAQGLLDMLNPESEVTGWEGV